MLNRFAATLLSVITISNFLLAQTNVVPFNHPNLYYQGRIKQLPDAAEFSWSGNSVTIHFMGTGIAAILKDADTSNYYNSIIDGKTITKIHLDKNKHSYTLASRLPKGEHMVQLFKRTEWEKGKTWFYGFEMPAGTTLLPLPEIQKRKIEFYGNSILCGYAMEDVSHSDSYKGIYENNYLSYAAVTARHFNAQYSCIGKSGIGVMISWFPMIMSDMYNRLDATDPTSKWDFTKFTPDVVVINLLQNDVRLVTMPQHPEFKHRFGLLPPTESFIVAAYKNLVQLLRNKYPNAHIICELGDLDVAKTNTPWPGYVQKAVTQMHDKKVYTHFFDYKNSPSHPTAIDHQVMANSLIAFIEKTVHW